jgi:23S rRNA pseudouridine2605 synthase
MTEVRLQKFLSQAGVTSRRSAERWIVAGRIKVNGKVCKELGTKVDPLKDRVEVDGKRVEQTTNLVYLLIHKPPGVITSLHDPEGRKTIRQLLPDNMPRVWPVGRLDWDSEGAILMTNDGDLTQGLTHPSYEVEKRYQVKVQKLLSEESPELDLLRNGVDMGEGDVSQPCRVTLLKATGKNTWVEFALHEGKNRQLRRMCEGLNLRIMRLRRIAIGPITVEGLPLGAFRPLQDEEIKALYKLIGTDVPNAAQPSRRQEKRSRRQEKAGRTHHVRRSGKKSSKK